PRLGGWTVTGDFGWIPIQNMRLGADFRTWVNGSKKDRPLPFIGTLTMLLSYYPRIRSGPFVEGGLGLSYYTLGQGTGDPIEPLSKTRTYNSGTGWGHTIGVGWEGHSVTPRVTYAYGKESGTVPPGWKQ